MYNTYQNYKFVKSITCVIEDVTKKYWKLKSLLQDILFFFQYTVILCLKFKNMPDEKRYAFVGYKVNIVLIRCL